MNGEMFIIMTLFVFAPVAVCGAFAELAKKRYYEKSSALLDKGYRLHSNGSLKKENGAERLE